MPIFEYLSNATGERHERFTAMGEKPRAWILVGGERCARVPSLCGVSFGGKSGDLWHGKTLGTPVSLYTEFKKGEGPTCDVPGKFDANGFRVMTSMRDVNEYKARSQDAGYPVRFAKEEIMDTRRKEKPKSVRGNW